MLRPSPTPAPVQGLCPLEEGEWKGGIRELPVPRAPVAPARADWPCQDLHPSVHRWENPLVLPLLAPASPPVHLSRSPELHLPLSSLGLTLGFFHLRWLKNCCFRQALSMLGGRSLRACLGTLVLLWELLFPMAGLVSTGGPGPRCLCPALWLGVPCPSSVPGRPHCDLMGRPYQLQAPSCSSQYTRANLGSIYSVCDFWPWFLSCKTGLMMISEAMLVRCLVVRRGVSGTWV